MREVTRWSMPSMQCACPHLMVFKCIVTAYVETIAGIRRVAVARLGAEVVHAGVTRMEACKEAGCLGQGVTVQTCAVAQRIASKI